jgi:hypothetical protein
VCLKHQHSHSFSFLNDLVQNLFLGVIQAQDPMKVLVPPKLFFHMQLKVIILSSQFAEHRIIEVFAQIIQWPRRQHYVALQVVDDLDKVKSDIEMRLVDTVDDIVNSTKVTLEFPEQLDKFVGRWLSLFQLMLVVDWLDEGSEVMIALDALLDECL